jgi:hypothetical protein
MGNPSYVVATATSFRSASQHAEPPAAPQNAVRFAAARANAVIIPAYLTFGVAGGVIAGSVGSWWPDIVLAAGILLFAVVVPLALFPSSPLSSGQRFLRSGQVLWFGEPEPAGATAAAMSDTTTSHCHRGRSFMAVTPSRHLDWVLNDSDTPAVRRSGPTAGPRACKFRG